MKIRNLVAGAAVTFAAATLLITRAADDKPAKAKEAAMPNMDEMMKKWEAYATPGAGHKALEPLVGEWEVDSKWWMAGPDGPPSVSKGTSKVNWTMGGRYLQEEYNGEFMEKPFQGLGLTAYDNFKKKYLNTWIDNMGTGMFSTEGTADAGGKVFTFEGKMDDPTTGQKDKPTKCIMRILSNDKHVFEVHDLTLGDKSKMAEMTYTRKK